MSPHLQHIVCAMAERDHHVQYCVTPSHTITAAYIQIFKDMLHLHVLLQNLITKAIMESQGLSPVSFHFSP